MGVWAGREAVLVGSALETGLGNMRWRHTNLHQGRWMVV